MAELLPEEVLQDHRTWESYGLSGEAAERPGGGDCIFRV